MMKSTWTLIGPDRKLYESSVKGMFGGHRMTRIYGRLTCRVALRAIEHGRYVPNRIFFLDEATAKAAGYRPCGVCMREEYLKWKAKR